MMKSVFPCNYFFVLTMRISWAILVKAMYVQIEKKYQSIFQIASPRLSGLELSDSQLGDSPDTLVHFHSPASMEAINLLIHFPRICSRQPCQKQLIKNCNFPIMSILFFYKLSFSTSQTMYYNPSTGSEGGGLEQQ